MKDSLTALPRHIDHDFVFTYKGLPILQNFRKSLKSACKDARITFGRDESDGLVFHDIRSTVKINMLLAGLDKVMRDVLLGHSLKGMDAYYLQLKDGHLKEAMDRYTAWLDEQFANTRHKMALGS